MLALICTYVGLVTFDRIKESHYPYATLVIGTALLFQTTLMSNGLVGTDIHSEYYYSLQALNGWNISIPHSYNSCIGSVIIAPALQHWLGIDMVWTYKIIFPLAFACSVPLLYLIFKSQFGGKTAFLGVFLFMSLPVWMIEMIGVPRQMLAELMLIACVYLITVSNLRMRIPLVCVSTALGTMFHYVASPTILAYLGTCTVFAVWFKNRRFPTKWLIISLVVTIIASGLWYGLTSSGVNLSSIIDVIRSSLRLGDGNTIDIIRHQAAEAGREVAFTDSATPLIQTALGFDFIGASVAGKIFRVFQYSTQILLAIGCIVVARNWRKYTPEFMGLMLAGIILAAIAVFVPMSITVIGTTRVYHTIMLFLSPAVILGGLVIFRNHRWLAICILIPYFLINAGVLFEGMKCEDITTADVPYSIALSHKRVDVAAVFSDNDIDVRDWAVDNNCEPIFVDINGELLFSEKMSSSKWTHIQCKGIDIKAIASGFALIPYDTSSLPEKCYIFLRERNIQTETVTFKPDWYKISGEKTGMRVSVTFEKVNLDETIKASTIAYRKGDAVLYEYNTAGN